MDKKIYDTYVAILGEELIPALGCTEPIAIAYAAAKAREVLGAMPEKIVVECSGNIIKNVKGVIVPTTGDMKGIDTSAILGSLLGGSYRKLEVLTAATPEDILKTRALLATNMCEVKLLEGVATLHVIVHSSCGADSATVEIADGHTNIIRVEKNGEVQFSGAEKAQAGGSTVADRKLLNMRDIFEFANTVNLDDVRDVLKRQVDLNLLIAQEGLTNPYGVNVGSCLLKYYDKDDVKIMAKALPAAGSDARMGGCVLPVVINSGSGNQGMTVSLPVVVYARALKVSDDMLYRALVMSNLTAIHQKTGLGKLSAYCGAVSAACGSGAGISYLHGMNFEQISRTITNTLGNVSGIVCDGAKPSCAAKIASAVDAAIMAHYMSEDESVFGAGEGIVTEDVEHTIRNVGRLGRDGMKSTDVEILNMMIGK
ncbi:MAG: L-serine ammonia-lyase, iron-sulfur-dependent, subunit alpha [Oscillospiraceae bacterium]